MKRYLYIIEIATNKIEKKYDITDKDEKYINKLDEIISRKINWNASRMAYIDKIE